MPKKNFKERHAWKKITAIVLSVGAVVFFGALFPTRFGKLPDGWRLERIMASPNYVNGEFRNQIPTPMIVQKQSWISYSWKYVLGHFWKYLLGSKNRLRPPRALPVVKTDLKSLDIKRNLLVWFGHSSCFLQIGGKRILLDPVFSSYASPFFFLNRAFEMGYQYTAEDMPEIDYLIISHDHWDHLDFLTVIALRHKIKAIICPLGVGEHLEYWGFTPEIIHEADWYEKLCLEPQFTVHVLPSRHFSGRGLIRNKTLWAGFMLEIGDCRVFYSGDGGYDPRFAEIGEKFGVVNLAIMEAGQYDQRWKYIHMTPEESVQGAEDLRAKAVIPVHAGKFCLCNHVWNDPYRRIVAASRGRSFKLLTPVIGEVVDIQDVRQSFHEWWEIE
ncbi:MAG: MBL fold metallo-hydrolase [Holosporaceae bacterium]|jgi:L-ascorbate metabolism protein UlaG (beta-lactamase superfamily)|nr:MBL fold metallo-hydrolase [Holosporaceae bacterium]